VGTADAPGIRTPDGVVRKLIPIAQYEKELKGMQDMLRPHSLQEKLKDPKYREELMGRRNADSAKHVFFLPQPGSGAAGFGFFSDLLASVVGMRDAIAGGIGTTNTLVRFMTPIRDQMDRGTCQTFSTIAEVESIYLRDFGLKLDLSENFAAHLGKSTFIDNPRIFDYESQTSLWGGGNVPGSTDLLVHYSVPTEAQAPYFPNYKQVALRDKLLGAEKGKQLDSPPTSHQRLIDTFEYSSEYITEFAHNAASYGVIDYTYIPRDDFKNTDTIEKFIDAKKPIAFQIDMRWKFNAQTGIHEYDDNWAGLGLHAMQILGYSHTSDDDKLNYFIIKNSWNAPGPDFISYDFLKRAGLDGLVVESVRDPNLATPSSTRWLGVWDASFDGLPMQLVIRRVPAPGKRARIGSIYLPGFDKEQVLSALADGESNLMFSVSDDVNSDPNAAVAPGKITGELIMPQRQARTLAGTMKATDGKSRGFLAQRIKVIQPNMANETPMELTRQGWRGTWALEVDGLPATLVINEVPTKGGKKILGVGKTQIQFTANYGLATEPAKAVLARIDTTDPQTLIVFANRGVMHLYRHSLNPGLVSGTFKANAQGSKSQGVLGRYWNKVAIAGNP
jgi:hypothetical protein